jgi:hypothetical protein
MSRTFPQQLRHQCKHQCQRTRMRGHPMALSPFPGKHRQTVTHMRRTTAIQRLLILVIVVLVGIIPNTPKDALCNGHRYQLMLLFQLQLRLGRGRLVAPTSTRAFRRNEKFLSSQCQRYRLFLHTTLTTPPLSTAVTTTPPTTHHLELQHSLLPYNGTVSYNNGPRRNWPMQTTSITTTLCVGIQTTRL